jgi:hypothetical protein
MAVIPVAGTALTQVFVPLSSVTAALRFVLELSQRPTVARIGYSADEREMTFWVFTEGSPDLQAEEEIFAAAQAVQRELGGPAAIHLHVIPPGQVSDAALPPFEVLYSRR